MKPSADAVCLGVDIGTSSVKAVLVDGSGAVRDEAGAPLAVSRPQPLWSEQDPWAWWRATEAAVLALDPVLRRHVAAIGLSGQMHGATLLGPDRAPLRPAILWNDGRSAAECAALEAALPELGAITGNRAMPGFTAPKLLWIRAHEPDIFKRIAKVLLPKDFVRLQMTGDIASDLSDSAGTLWLDVGRRAWSEAALAATGLELRHMPALHEGPEPTGRLRRQVADAWGMAEAPVVGGGGDNAAGAVGAGVVAPGEAFLSLGTSGVLFVADDAFRPNPQAGVHAFCHALPGRWCRMAVILSAASCLDWAAKLTGAPDAGALLGQAEARNRAAADEIFLPYLSGERTPHNDPHAKGVLFGLTHDSDAAAVGQAVLEGVAFALRDGLDALSAAGAAPREISVIGGGARSAYWGRILASALGRELVYRDAASVGPAFGAARLARLALHGEDVARACSPPPIRHVAQPDPRFADAFAATLPRYRALYDALKPSFREPRL